MTKKFIKKVKYFVRRTMVKILLTDYDLDYIYTYEEPQFFSHELIEKYNNMAKRIAAQVPYKSYKTIKIELIENRIRYLTEFKEVLRKQNNDSFVEYNLRVIDVSIKQLRDLCSKIKKR